jgi:AraC-like DNA-binding protein
MTTARVGDDAGSEERAYEHWFAETPEHSPATWTFEGASGLARLSGPTMMTAPEPSRFRARLVRVQLDHVALESFAAGAHRSERDAGHLADPARATYTFVLVAEGVLHVECGPASFDVDAGRCMLLDSRTPLTWWSEGDVRLLRSIVGAHHIPIGLRHRGLATSGPLQRTPLVDAFIAFVSNVLRSAAVGRPVAGSHTTRAVADLHTAILAEAQDASPEPPREPGLRSRIEDHIERHLDDPELGPASIAQAMGVSLRHVHGTFNEDDRTIARYIRERRLAAVAAALRTTEHLPPVEHLAHRFGFNRADAMQRAFRHRLGMSISEFHRRGHRDLH